ncbi:hypothetical protein WAI453_008460 [Rhynchosporium graminicola]
MRKILSAFISALYQASTPTSEGKELGAQKMDESEDKHGVTAFCFPIVKTNFEPVPIFEHRKDLI